MLLYLLVKMHINKLLQVLLSLEVTAGVRYVGLGVRGARVSGIAHLEWVQGPASRSP